MDNMLFWGGFVFSASALIFGGVYFIFYKLRVAKLNKILDIEYGEREKTAKK